MTCGSLISYDHDLFSVIQVAARSMSVFTLGLNCCEWGDSGNCSHQLSDQLIGSVYLTAWMIIRMTRYTVITVARLHTPEHTNTKMQTLCRLPSSSQQWLPPPPLDSSMMRPELATRGSVLLVTWAMGVTRILPSAPTPRLLTMLSRKFFTRPWRLKMRTFTTECLTQLYYEVGLCFCMGWTLNCQSL